MYVLLITVIKQYLRVLPVADWCLFSYKAFTFLRKGTCTVVDYWGKVLPQLHTTFFVRSVYTYYITVCYNIQKK